MDSSIKIRGRYGNVRDEEFEAIQRTLDSKNPSASNDGWSNDLLSDFRRRVALGIYNFTLDEYIKETFQDATNNKYDVNTVRDAIYATGDATFKLINSIEDMVKTRAKKTKDAIMLGIDNTKTYIAKLKEKREQRKEIKKIRDSLEDRLGIQKANPGQECPNIEKKSFINGIKEKAKEAMYGLRIKEKASKAIIGILGAAVISTYAIGAFEHKRVEENLLKTKSYVEQSLILETGKKSEKDVEKYLYNLRNENKALENKIKKMDFASYTIGKGDNLIGVANKAKEIYGIETARYGSKQFSSWAKSNGIKDQNSIYPGKKLFLYGLFNQESLAKKKSMICGAIGENKVKAHKITKLSEYQKKLEETNVPYNPVGVFNAKKIIREVNNIINHYAGFHGANYFKR